MCFVKICQQCGKEFTTRRYPTQFCSPRCYNQHKRTEQNKRKLQLIKQYDSHIDVVMEDGKLRYIKQCDHCGKEFTAYKQTTMFCSSACAKKYRIRQSLEERATKVTAESRRQDAQRKESAFAAKVYGLPLNVTQNYLRRSDLPFERFRNVRLYKREEVDRLLRKRERDQHHEIEEWYTVEDIMTEYEMTRKQVYNLMGVNPKLPRRKEGLKTFLFTTPHQRLWINITSKFADCIKWRKDSLSRPIRHLEGSGI